VPVEALELESDITAMEIAVRLLRGVNAATITFGSYEMGEAAKWITLKAIEVWLQTARKKLHYFMAPEDRVPHPPADESNLRPLLERIHKLQQQLT